jgi:hypothetical protein
VAAWEDFSRRVGQRQNRGSAGFLAAEPAVSDWTNQRLRYEEAVKRLTIIARSRQSESLCRIIEMKLTSVLAFSRTRNSQILRTKNMRENKCFNTNTYLRLLLIAPAIALLGLSACSTADGTARHNYRGGYADIPPRGYNPESRGYDRPWPFGPESTQQ